MHTLPSSLLLLLSFTFSVIILFLQVSASPLPSSSSWSPSSVASVSPWDQMDLFNLPFNVQAEEISDEEWVDMMTRDLQRHKVLPQIIDQVPPYVINVDYTDEHCVHLGNHLQPRHTQKQPLRISFPTNRSSNGNSGSATDSGSSGLYTLMAIDPDVPPHGSGNAGSYSQFLQWLVVNIPDEDIERGDVLAEYLGPLPSQQQQGEHRFIFLAYRQPDEPIDVERVGLPHAEPCDWAVRARFSSSRFAQLYDLGRPVAVNYFVTQYDASVPQTIERCLIQRQSLGRLLSQHISSSST